jgi:plastocyanin
MKTCQRIAVSALLLATACSGGSSSGSDVTVTGTVTADGAPDAQRVSLDMTDNLTFVPNVVDARSGTLSLSLTNAGGVPHNLVFDDSSLGKTGTVKGHGTATLSVRFDKAGTYQFVCTFHSGMDGKVVVTG